MDQASAAQETPVSQTSTQQPMQQVDLTNVPVTNENTSLNLMVGFLNIAQKRGAFNLKESAKIWECIKIFQKQMPGPQGPENNI